MKTISLKKLSLINFKGIKSLEIDFSDNTSIFGANEAGKTSVFDAFTFLLFGKDSLDRKEFGIKNTVHPELNRQEHEVSGQLIVNGELIVLKRIYKEKWSKPKGSTRAVLSGNVQEFYWNDVPVQAGQFAAKIEEVFTDEKVFKLITNPLYFNTEKLVGWKQRREFLFKLAGDVTDSDVASANPKFAELASIISTKTMDGYKAEINAKRKKLKDNLEAIPHRIDELLRSLPEAIDFESLAREAAGHQSSIADIDILIADINKANQSSLDFISAKQREVHRITSSLKDIEFELERNFRNGQNEISQRRHELSTRVDEITRSIQSKTILRDSQNDKMKGLDLRRTNLREIFNTTNQKQLEFAESDCVCPTCKREFDASDIEAKKSEMHRNFIADKNRALDEIDEKGKALAAEIDECSKMISTLDSVLEQLNMELTQAISERDNFNNNNPVKTFDLIEAVTNSTEHKQQRDLLDIANQLLKDAETAKDTDERIGELTSQKQQLQNNLNSVNAKLNQKTVIESTNARIDELKNEEANLASQLAEYDGVENELNEFTKAKIELIEARINGKFQYVKFKMYDYTIDGSPVETCDTLYKGVPFADLNTAGKIWAGIDIINTLSDHYKVHAPIFLDNRESVTLIPATDSQIVNLIVSPEDKKLRVAQAS